MVFTVGLMGVKTGKEVRMGSEKKQEKDRAELKLREIQREEGKSSRKPGSGLDGGHQRPSQLLPRSSPAHFAGLVPASVLSIGCATLMLLALQDRAVGEARDKRTEILGNKLTLG